MSLRCAAAYSQLLQAELTLQEQAASSALPIPRGNPSLEGQQCRWPALGMGGNAQPGLMLSPPAGHHALQGSDKLCMRACTNICFRSVLGKLPWV